MTNKYTTLDAIVRDLISQEGSETPHSYMRYLNIANAGLRELTFDVLGSTKIALLEVNSNMRVDLPEGFVDYTFIGIVSSDGNIIPLGMRRDIPLVGTQNVVMQNDVIRDENSHETFLNPQYGHGGGQNKYGYYNPKIDYDNWQIVFSSKEVGSFVYLEFISDGRVSGGETVVHPYAEEALKAYVYWKSIQRLHTADPNQIMMSRKDYFNEKRLAKSRLNSFTKEEALQQARKHYKQSPKF